MAFKDLFSKKQSPPVDDKYPKWEAVSKDPALLPDRMLKELQKAMIFIVNDAGKEHAAVAVRADQTEFQTAVTSSTPIRLYVGYYAGQNGDIFSIYPLILDNPSDPMFKETWMSPYEDPEGIENTDPLSAESHKRLKLLFNQKYVWMLFINNQNQILFSRKVPITPSQQITFKNYQKKLGEYQGKHIAKMQYFALLQEYMNVVPMNKLQQEFLALFR